MGEQGKATETKVLSVRVPVGEMQQIDADAKAAGMNRNDFIRMKVKQESAFADAEKIGELVDALRQLTLMMDTYLGILKRLVESFPNDEGEKEMQLVFAEIERADDMMRLLLKTQEQTVKALRGMHRDLKR